MKSFTSDRLACLDLPAFSLQLLLRRHPDWAGHPAAVVTEDKPQGLVLWVNEKARRQGVLPGRRCAAAFSLAPTLRAGVVPPAEIKKTVGEWARRLMHFTPGVEPSAQEPGVFWLSGAGLNHLYPSPQKWSCAIYRNVRAGGFSANLTVGFTRFGTYAVAKAKPGVTIFHNPSKEKSAARDVPLDRLNIEPAFYDLLFKLGIKTIGDLLTLPPGGLRERFGKAAHRLYRMAAGDLWTPLEARAPEEPIVQKYILDDAESDATRLLFLVKQLLHPLLRTLAARRQALAALRLSLLIDHGGWLGEPLRPAEPTLDAGQILDLVRLRLEALQFTAGVIEVELRAESCAAGSEQLRLFAEKPKRDLDAANRALARLGAEFGGESVAYARLTDGHLPEARFTWEPLLRIKLSKPNSFAEKTLVRRVSAKPICFAGEFPRSREDGRFILGPKHDAVHATIGPYVFSGGWWHNEIQREYYYAETRTGDLLWLYYDRVRRQWFWQGAVE